MVRGEFAIYLFCLNGIAQNSLPNLDPRINPEVFLKVMNMTLARIDPSLAKCNHDFLGDTKFCAAVVAETLKILAPMKAVI